MKRNERMEEIADERLVQLAKSGEIDALPSKYRLAFILVENQGLSHKQASVVLRCAEKTISWRMHKARKMLQDSLQDDLVRGML